MTGQRQYVQRVTPHMWYWILEAEPGKIEEAQNWPPCYGRTAPVALRGPEYGPPQGPDGLPREIQVDGSKIQLPRSTSSGCTGDTHDIGQHAPYVNFDTLRHRDGNGARAGLEIVDIEVEQRSRR